MKKFIVGSTYFFGKLQDFKSKDIDRLALIHRPIGFKLYRQTTTDYFCLFEWKQLSADEFVEYSLTCKTAMTVGKFLVPEVCEQIGFTIEHLKKLKPVFDRLDDKHKYEKVIYEAYVNNGKFELTDEQRLAVYEVYKEARKESD